MENLTDGTGLSPLGEAAREIYDRKLRRHLETAGVG